jgi:TusA-related sulfurtransferase
MAQENANDVHEADYTTDADYTNDLLRRLGLELSMEELQERFKVNDQSASSFMKTDMDSLTSQEAENVAIAKKLVRDNWEPLAQQMGLPAPSNNYGEDNPLIALRDNMENLAAGGLLQMMSEHPEMINQIWDYCEATPDIELKASAMLRDAVEATLLVMDYPKLVQVMKEIPAAEDFNYMRRGNHRRIDFERKWNHSRAQIKTVSLEQIRENQDSRELNIPASAMPLEDQALSVIQAQRFWESVTDEKDRRLLQLKMQGKTQQEIADELNFKNHSAVTKRLQKLKRRFDEIDNMD